MRIDHIFFELDSFIRDVRANAEIALPTTKKYGRFFAKELETRVAAIRSELTKINYEEVD
jgi:hypothetical protein